MSAERVFLKGNMAKLASNLNENEREIVGAGLTDMVSRFLEKKVNPFLKEKVKETALAKQRAKAEPPKPQVKAKVNVKSTLHPKAKNVPHPSSRGVEPATVEVATSGDVHIPQVVLTAKSASTKPMPKNASKVVEPDTLVRQTFSDISDLAKSDNVKETPVEDNLIVLGESIDTIVHDTQEMAEKVAEASPPSSDEVPMEDVDVEVKLGEGESPILCRTGTKKDIAWWLIERFNPVYKKRYMEAFFGGGAIFWAKPKVGKEFINEFNPQIYDFYVRLKKGFGNAIDLMPELSNYTKSVQKFGKAKWLAELSKYYGESYISTTKLSATRNPEQLMQIDKIARIIIPFLRNNPIVLEKKKDKYKNEYDVIKKSVKGGEHDSLVCLYWYLIAYCNGQSNTVIPLRDLQCISENEQNLVKSREETETADGEVKEGRAIVETMPIKKSSNPYNKLNEMRGKWFHERLSNVDILNDDALHVAPTHDSKDTFFMFDPPYEQGGGYGIGTTNEENISGSGKKKEKKEADENDRLSAKDEKVFPFRKFVQMCDDLKGKWMVTINGSVRILNEFRDKKNPVYGAKLWVKNKVGNSWRFEIVYANYEFKDSLNVKSEEFKDAPEYMVFSNKSVVPITYNKRTLPHQDNIDGAKGLPKGAILKPKDESKPDKEEKPHPCVKSAKRKAPIANSVLPLLDVNEEVAEEAPAPKEKKSRAKKTAEPAVVAQEPVNEIIPTPEPVAEAPKAKRKYVRKPKVAEEPALEPYQEGQGRPRYRGGYYSPNRPMFHGGKVAYTPSVGYGGSEYDSGSW